MTDATQINVDELAVDGLWMQSRRVDWQDIFQNADEYGEPMAEVILPHVDQSVLDEYADEWKEHCPIENYSDEFGSASEDQLNDAIEGFQDGDFGRFYEWQDSFYPMMNYAYPVTLRHGDVPRDVATRIAAMAGCVTLVHYQEQHFLALTGGGMDLSWEICAAYIACRVMPPLQFLRDLPHMADKPNGEVDALVLAAMERASDILRATADQMDVKRGQFNNEVA